MLNVKEAAAVVAGMSLDELDLVDDDRKTVTDAVARRRVELGHPVRTFVLVDGINSYSFGADPHYEVVAGEPLQTADRRLAARLDADDHFSEVT